MKICSVTSVSAQYFGLLNIASADEVPLSHTAFAKAMAVEKSYSVQVSDTTKMQGVQKPAK